MEALIMVALVFVLFYLFMIFPMQRQNRRRRKQLAALRVGDEVATVGGLIGQIVALGPEELTLRLAQSVEVRLLREAVTERRQAASPKEDAS